MINDLAPDWQMTGILGLVNQNQSTGRTSHVTHCNQMAITAHLGCMRGKGKMAS
jgi:hypothetical protein